MYEQVLLYISHGTITALALTTHYSAFSVLNFSQASFKVAKTAALIIFCSVVAEMGSYR